MKYIFKDNETIGEYPVKNFQIAFYNEDGDCFDEDFVEPENFNHRHLSYVMADENYVLSRVFANMKDGSVYELKFEKVNY